MRTTCVTPILILYSNETKNKQKKLKKHKI